MKIEKRNYSERLGKVTSKLELIDVGISPIKVNFIGEPNQDRCTAFILKFEFTRLKGKPIIVTAQAYQDNDGKLLDMPKITETRFKESGKKTNFNTYDVLCNIKELLPQIKEIN